MRVVGRDQLGPPSRYPTTLRLYDQQRTNPGGCQNSLSTTDDSVGIVEAASCPGSRHTPSQPCTQENTTRRSEEQSKPIFGWWAPFARPEVCTVKRCCRSHCHSFHHLRGGGGGERGRLLYAPYFCILFDICSICHYGNLYSIRLKCGHVGSEGVSSTRRTAQKVSCNFLEI